jgi:hypothetical protein
VRPFGFPRSHRQDASNTASTTDVLRYEHPLSNTIFGDCLPRARGKPAGTRLRGTPRDAAFPPFASRDALNHLAVIQPPTAPCLTARCRLRVDWPPRAVPEHFSQGERRRFFGERQPGQIEPSDTFTSDGAERERPDACRLSLLQPVHVNATGLSRPEVPSIERDPSRALFRGSWGAPPSLAGEFGAARLHRCSKTPTRPLAARCSRAPSRPRALVRLLQMYALTSTTEDRSNIPNHRDEWLGRLPCSFESRPSKRGQSPELHEVRGREHRVSTLPVTIARAGDFAPTPIASGTSCRRHRSLPCPERLGEKAMPPPPAHACMARAA